ncbi:TonB-dependent receptor [Pontibacter qinzhouensis]|uniref:TonB-dependent receptor n=1 Tax=Pontibacter qinzhouensis TaxID=2603253 RepID=A0A5C8J0W1_9BACT|nr:TonB-dependent receptor [Pontibacter qinzhouensis]TXK27403.1 TonB-dependent receptor [Pontibacter qinzhouensis]
MKNIYLRIALALALILPIQLSWGQGSTTASLSGVVRDNNGEELPGATVVAIHTPTNTQYASPTNTQGRFNIQNMRVGGPYTITVSFVGFQDRVTENISLTLGQTLNLNLTLNPSSLSLNQVEVVSDRDNIINGNRTGAATTIRSEQIATLPTVSRQINDFVRLTPQADIKGTSISIAGINNRFNQLTIDGAVSNDVFGLSGTGTNGGSTGTSPISLDAIEQFNVQIAPFDVRLGGFAGGGISAVTRSGTNDFSGSAYYFTRNQNLAGKTPGGLLGEGQSGTRFADFSEKQYGFRIGGPIIKDKLFFFLNAEKTSSTTPRSFAPGEPSSEITLEEAQRVAARALALGYDPGSFGEQNETSASEKLFGRLDWNLSEKHKLTARYSYTFGETVQISRTPRALTFSNGGILRESTTNSAVIELNSRFSNSISNNFVAGYTRVREPRTAPGAPFPRVFIDLGGSRSISLGTEAFSTVNQLDQNIFTLTDNVTIFKGKHTITVGTHNELYDMYNAFIGNAYGDYRFTNSPATNLNPATNLPYTAIENFERGIASGYTYQYSRTSDPREGAKFKAMQLGFYGQDEFQVTDNLNLTAGLRLDVPIYLDEPMENEDFNNSVLAQRYDVRTNRMPKPAFMWSPRLGFNWDVKGDRTTQVRGGTGIFTSRFPFVWAGGAFTQSGVLLDQNRLSTANNAAPAIAFNPDPFNQTKRTTVSQPGGNITVLASDFKVPQIFRTNIAIDQQLPLGVIGTAEFLYSKNLNSFNFRNINLVEPSGNMEGADNRTLYPATNTRVLPNYTEVVYIENVNKGYSWTATAQLQKSFENGFYGSLAYSYTESKDLNPGTSSQNQSNYYRVASVNGSNNLTVGNSPFNVGSRIVGAVSYRKEYLSKLATAVSLFYTGQSGTPFSYTVRGDLNRSTFSTSTSDYVSLIYIPRDASEIRFAGTDAEQAAQWAAFNTFIENNEYLADRRGQYAERNGVRTPFTHQFDVKLSQDIFTDIAGKRNTLQFTIDILNVGNLINKNWGERYGYGSSYFDNTFQILDLDRFEGNTPVYKFARRGTDLPYTISDAPIGGSRWVGQIGLRYIFN